MTSFLNPAAGSGYLGRYNKMANMKTNFLTKTAWDQHIVGTSEEEGRGHPLDTF